MNKEIGIIREFDNLGRLVIPKEMRTLFNFKKKVEIELLPKAVSFSEIQNTSLSK